MKQQFSFSYRLEKAGWSTATVSDGEHTLTLNASYLSDALGDLTRAVIALLRGAEQAVLLWHEEPGVVEWRFERRGDDVNVYVTQFDDWNRYRSFRARQVEPSFRVQCPLSRLAAEVLDELWHIYEAVGIDGYKERWEKHAFPLEEYRELGDLLSDRAKQRRTPSNAAAQL